MCGSFQCRQRACESAWCAALGGAHRAKGAAAGGESRSLSGSTGVVLVRQLAADGSLAAGSDIAFLVRSLRRALLSTHSLPSSPLSHTFCPTPLCARVRA
eukprot:6206006-Pleurochrysis_carterae.AAC.2